MRPAVGEREEEEVEEFEELEEEADVDHDQNDPQCLEGF